MSSPPLSQLLNWINRDRTALDSVDETSQPSGQQGGTTSSATNSIVGRNQATNNTELAATAAGQDNLQRFSETFGIRSQPTAYPGFEQGLAERFESQSPYPSDLEVLDSDTDACYKSDEMHNPMGVDLMMSVPSDLGRYRSVERALFRLRNVYDGYCNVCSSVDDVQDVFYMLSRWLEFLWRMRRQRGMPPTALSWRIEEVARVVDALVRVLVCRQGGGWRAPRPLRIRRWPGLSLPTICRQRRRG